MRLGEAARAALLLAALAMMVLLIAQHAAVAARHGRVTGLPIPRFVSLRADKVNLRVGPGFRYPIEWVLQRRDLPVEIIGEFATWRKLRLHDGTTGWVSQTLLSAHRTIILTGSRQVLRAAPREHSRAIAELAGHVIARLISCRAAEAWCRVAVRGYRGYLRRGAIWGVAADEQYPP